MPNPLSVIRGSLKNIKDDYSIHAGINLSGGTYDSCWKNLCELISVDNALKSAKLLGDLREAGFIMKKKSTSDVLITSILSNKYRSFARSCQVKREAPVDRKILKTPRRIKAPTLSQNVDYEGVLPIQRNNITMSSRKHWKEQDLEDYLVKNWDVVDMNLNLGKLELIGRQKRLGNSRDHVDLLALSLNGVYVAIELKIKRAGGSELTQLQSYIQDMKDSERKKFVGVLVAPEFSTKVQNVARGLDQVFLRNFKSKK
jgi:hypothetical protein